MARIELAGVEKVFADGTRAVRPLDLEIEDGELMVLVGPSGCGKSTVLRMLAGLEDVTSGTIRIAGRVVNDLPPQERNVAMVFQDYALYPFMTVRRNLAFPLKMRRLSRAEIDRRVEQVADFLGLTSHLDRMPKHLSGGQRQRVAMGRALVREPSVFLLDEPLSNLDAKLRVQVRADIGDLQRRTGTTMVYVTHDQVEAMTLGHRVAVLNEGSLQQVATPSDLYQHPANTFVATFIGTPPMNLFPAVLSATGGRLSLHVGEESLPLSPERVPQAGISCPGHWTAGIRPEDFRFVASTEPGLRARVENAEYLGHETLAYVAVGEGDEAVKLVIRIPGTQLIGVGEALRIGAPSELIHFFDEAGNAVRRA